MNIRVIAVLALGLLAACGGDEGPDVVPPPQLVYIEGDLGGTLQRVVAIRADGTDRRVLAEGTTQEPYVMDVLPSPDGEKVLYAISDIINTLTWFEVALDGGSPVPTVLPPNAMPLEWSPNGAPLLLQVVNRGSRLATGVPGSTALEWASPEGLAVAQANWAPDASRLTFSANTAGIWELTIYLTDQFGVPDAISDGSGVDRGPAMSPSEEVVAFVREGEGVYLARQGTPERVLVPGSFGPFVHWSPDGSWLLGERWNVWGYDLVRINAETGSVEVLMGTSGQRLHARYPWSADGSLITVGLGPTPDEGENQLTVTVLRPDGSGVTSLVPGTMWGGMPRWVPSAE